MIFFDIRYIAALAVFSLFFWFIVPERYKTHTASLFSAAILALIQPKFTIFLFILTLGVFYGALFMLKVRARFRLLIMIVLSLTVVLLGFKYFSVLFVLIFSGENSFASAYLPPLGLSYLCFKMMAFIFDVYRGNIEKPDMGQFILFIVFIPMFSAGPIEKYQNFAFSRRAAFESEFYAGGIQRIAVGYFKKIVMVNFVLNELVNKELYPVIINNGVSMDLPAHIGLIYIVGALLYAYLDISSYADIAIGYGQLFGYKICENMNYPIFRKNLSDYWNGWHMSLSFWCRDNVYFPVLGKTRNIGMALYSSFLVMGLWHNISWNWLIWAAWHATGLIVYTKWARFKKKRRLTTLIPDRIGYATGMILTVMYASFGYAFVFLEKPSEAARLLVSIFI